MKLKKLIMYLNGLIEDDPAAAECEVMAAVNAIGQAHEHPVVGKVEFVLTDYQLSPEIRRYRFKPTEQVRRECIARRADG